MKILHGQELVTELRKLSDRVTKRLWIVVPYIGSPTTVRRILGREWFDSPTVSVKLLTDTSDLSCLDTETIQLFYNRGQVKTITGLHAKIYIADDFCIVTSANLTNTAFSKRHEIGILLTPSESKQVIETFNVWWKKSENVKPEKLTKIFKKVITSKEERGVSLPTLFDLPEDPGSFIKNLAKRFLNYDRLVADYEDFAKKYSSIQRIWKNKPLYFEIDGLFNYLYHHAPNTPSKEYSKEQPRNLTEQRQMDEIKKWALKYKEWNKNVFRVNHGEDDIEWRMYYSKTLKRFLSSNHAKKLTKKELIEILHCLNSLNSYPINRTKILNNNSLSEIRNALNHLVNGEGQLASRMNECNNINYLGTSSMQEILGFTSPDIYPLINKNSNSGLRFFCYQVKAYN